jgi:ribosomal protein S17
MLSLHQDIFMETILDREFGGERPLYNRHGLRLENVTIHAGESSIKEGSDIEAHHCRFEGKYVFWCCENFLAADCHFTEAARSSLWHSRGMELRDCLQEAPKMFRESEDMRLRRVVMPHAHETFWSCSGIDIEDVEAREADYIFMHCSDVRVRNLRLFGNYAFQHARNVEIRDSDLQSKDSLWESENVTIYDSFINGEYLGWHSRNLRLVCCRIGGTQPLCYIDGLVLEDCTFEPDADLALEYSDVQATIKGHVVSIKNPRTGHVKVESCGEVIRDANAKAPDDCVIESGYCK